MSTKDDLLVISFSGGQTSGLMTKILMDNAAYKKQLVCFMNTGREHEKTLKFVHDFEVIFNIPIVWLEFDFKENGGFKMVNYETASRNGEPFAKMLSSKTYLPNVVKRFCTTELKIRPLKKYIMSLGYKQWTQAVGLRFDEQSRIARINSHKNRFWTICPLNEFKTTKQDVLNFWNSQSFKLEIESYLGNCDCCFLKGIKKIKRIERETPELLDWWIEQEKKSNGATFRKDTSYSLLRHLVKINPTLFDQINDIADIECFCNVD